MCKRKSELNQHAIDEILNCEQVNDRGRFHTTLQVNEVPVRFEVDSGAAVTLMYIEEARKYFKDTRLFRTDVKLISYFRSRIKIHGYISVRVKYLNNVLNLNIYLTDVERDPLLGREWLHAMQ